MAEHEGSRSGEGRSEGRGHGRNDNRGEGRGYGRGSGRSGNGGQGGRGRRPQGDGRGGDSRGGRGGQRGFRGRDDERRGNRRGERRDGFRGERRDGERKDWNNRGEHGDRNERRDDRRGGFRGRDGERNDRRDDRRDDRRGGQGGHGGRGGHGHGGDRRRSNRGGRFQDEKRTPRTGPQRPGFREERIAARKNEPSIPDDVKADELDASVRQDLKSLAKDNADMVARHMIMAASLLSEDPQLALAHARAAKDRAGRVGVVRETAGVTAYHAGEWKEALSELRAARRILGGAGLLAVMADCERGLGRPEKAIEIGRSDEAKMIDAETATELAIVVAGARRDLGQIDEAIIELETQDLNPERTDFEAARLFYAYADALLAAGRTEDAKTWFSHSARIDEDEFLDSRERLEELS